LRQQGDLLFLHLHQLDPFLSPDFIELGMELDDFHFRFWCSLHNRAEHPDDREPPPKAATWSSMRSPKESGT